MPIPDDDMLGPRLEKRLKAALDEVVPPSPLLSSARYRVGAAKRPSRAWRFAPALVAMAAAGAVLTATAATGSPNPAVWRDRAGTVILNVSHFPGSSPKAAHSPSSQPRATAQGQGTGSSRATPSGGQESEPKESPEPAGRPGQSPRPEPTPSENPQPSPTGDSSGGSQGSSTPSPSPDDGGN